MTPTNEPTEEEIRLAAEAVARVVACIDCDNESKKDPTGMGACRRVAYAALTAKMIDQAIATSPKYLTEPPMTSTNDDHWFKGKDTPDVAKVLDEHVTNEEIAASARKKVSELNNLLMLLYNRGVQVDIDTRVDGVRATGISNTVNLIRVQAKFYVAI